MPTCPHCGHETDDRRPECPLCGTPLDTGSELPGREDGARRGTGPGGAEDPGPAPERVPWEDPDLPFPTDLWRTWTSSLFSPSGFFRRVDDGGTIVRPLLYYLLLTLAGALCTLLWQAVWTSTLELDAYVGIGEAAAAGPVISFFATPFVALLVLAVVTLVYHLGALVLAPDRQGLGATARVVCYAAGPSVLAAVPVLGSLAGGLWSLGLQVVGLREAHRTTTGRAVLMVLWIWVLFFLFVVGLGVLAALLGTGGSDPGTVVRALPGVGG